MAARLMKAVIVRELGAPSVLKVEQVPVPKPKAGEVLVYVKAVGVNPSDTYVRAGNVYKTGPNLPYTPGGDGAGVIEEVGAGVTQFKVGDRVYFGGSLTGSYAEAAICTANQVHPLPAKVSFGQGAGLYVPYATAYHALFHRAKARPGETVFVHGGSGGVGVAAVQIARSAGLRVIATAGTPEGRQFVETQGAHHVLDHHAADYLKQLVDLTGGKGVDIIVEMLANINLAKDLTVLSKFGRVVVVGSRGPIEITPRELMTRDGCILGTFLGNTSPEEFQEIFAALYAGLESGVLNPVVGKQYPLEEAPLAHEEIINPKTPTLGKMILLP